MHGERAMITRGFWLRDEADKAIDYQSPVLAAVGALVVAVAGVNYHPDGFQQDAFAPGQRVALVPEPDNPHDPNAVGVWDEQHRWQAGYIPKDLAPQVAQALRRPGGLAGISMLEFRKKMGGKGRNQLRPRVGLRVLIGPPELLANLTIEAAETTAASS